MREEVLLNFGMWCRVEDIVLVQDMHMVQYGYIILSGVKGIHNSFILYYNCDYIDQNNT